MTSCRTDTAKWTSKQGMTIGSNKDTKEMQVKDYDRIEGVLMCWSRKKEEMGGIVGEGASRGSLSKARHL